MRSNSISNLALGLATLAAPSEAFWRMSCPGRVARERADPIVNPGAVSSHLHTISGGNGFGFTENFDQARGSQCSSCTIKQDFSNYWTPQLYFKAQNGSFTPVPVVGDPNDLTGGMTVYYLQRGNTGETLKAFPKDFRMLAGNPMLRNFTGGVDAQAISYACLGTSNAQTNNIPNYNCPGGLRAQVFFPSCWDGVNLDSKDHKSHMSYPSGGHFDSGPCPASHPVHLISIFYEVLYDTGRFSNEWHGSSHPFVFSMGDATGYGFHGDFINGWELDVLQAAVTDCTSDSGKVEDCKHFTQYTGTECQNCRLPSYVDEQVDGWLKALPGCNPVTSGPEPATMQTGCGDPTTIGKPDTNFVDLTVSMKWEYAGCGTDQYYTRTLTGKSEANDQMTVGNCVNFCKSNGYSYAGLEYSRECYCGNSIAAGRAPIPGVMGNCQMKCKGDSGEYCGGASALSIYHACGNGPCQNVHFGGSGNVTTAANGSGSDSDTQPQLLAQPAASSAPAGSVPTSSAPAASVPAGSASSPTPSLTISFSGEGVSSQSFKAAGATKVHSSTVASYPAAPTQTGGDDDEWDCGDDE